MTRSTKITAIVPATDEPPTLDRCLDAIRAGSRPPDELIVVTEPAGAGPAEARNSGAERATGELLVFVDADVIVAPDALARIESALDADPALTAVFGSYDDMPEAPGAISGFRNLLHHHVHHAAAGPVPTFWAGLGAIRNEALAEAGGFDAERYPRPSIEDIELGARLAARDRRVVLDPAIQGTHLKKWTLGTFLRTDFARRGVPWVELVARTRAPAGVLNLGWRHRLSALASLGATLALVRRRPLALAAALGTLLALNRDFYALLRRKRGTATAAAGIGLHVVHHVTSAAALAAGLVRVAADRWTDDRRSV